MISRCLLASVDRVFPRDRRYLSVEGVLAWRLVGWGIVVVGIIGWW